MVVGFTTAFGAKAIREWIVICREKNLKRLLALFEAFGEVRSERVGKQIDGKVLSITCVSIGVCVRLELVL